MHPEPLHRIQVLHCFGDGEEDSANDPAELLEAEQVVGVIRRGQQVFDDELVDVEGGGDNLIYAGIELLAESLRVQVPEDNPAEDGRDRRVREQVDVDRVEVPDEPVGHGHAAPVRGSHRPRDLHLDQPHRKELLVVIPINQS